MLKGKNSRCKAWPTSTPGSRAPELKRNTEFTMQQEQSRNILHDVHGVLGGSPEGQLTPSDLAAIRSSPVPNRPGYVLRAAAVCRRLPLPHSHRLGFLATQAGLFMSTTSQQRALTDL